MNLNLKGKNVVITGASSGVGRATAIAFSNQGANVFLGARRLKELDETKELCGNADIKEVDLSNTNSIFQFCEEAKDKLKVVDIVVNSAAYLLVKTLNELTLEEWNYTMAVNMTAPFLIYQGLYDALSQNGTIVNVSSIAGVQNIPRFAGFGAYTTSKMALGGLTEMMAAELKSKNVRVNALCPAAVDTPMLKVAIPNLEHAKKVNAMTPEKLAEHVLWYASELSAPANGQTIILK
jgi:NAD(P)-dependent dehydrogenase (short-subunit alcohol dehydrogenase family)